MLVILFYSFILVYILLSISKEDVRTMLISDSKLISFATLGISYLAILGLLDKEINIKNLLMNNFNSMIIIFILMCLISFISYKIFNINSLGLGDIKLSSISALWLGFKLSIVSLFISFFLSAMYYIYGKVTKRFKKFHQYPFAPFLSIGILCSWTLEKI